jgi:hypothetical protein
MQWMITAMVLLARGHGLDDQVMVLLDRVHALDDHGHGVAWPGSRAG